MKELKEDNILKGKEMLTQYAKSKGYKISMYTKTQFLESVMRKYGFRDWDSVLAAIGHGGLKEGQVVNRLLEEYEKDHKKEITDENILEKISEANKQKVHIARSKSGIVVKGINDMQCCFPSAAIRFREMRLSVLLREEEVCLSTGQTASM